MGKSQKPHQFCTFKMEFLFLAKFRQFKKTGGAFHTSILGVS
jgi:hypothetical protein